MAACISSRVSRGYASSRSASLAPSLNFLRISSTVILVPRITGLPIITFGLISIRSVTAIANLPADRIQTREWFSKIEKSALPSLFYLASLLYNLNLIIRELVEFMNNPVNLPSVFLSLSLLPKILKVVVVFSDGEDFICYSDKSSLIMLPYFGNRKLLQVNVKPPCGTHTTSPCNHI